MRKLILTLLLLAPACFGQASAILTGSRNIDWGLSGLPATLPDGETTPNGWTPPTRTQSGSTLTPSGSDDETQIASAWSSCTSGHFILLGAGSFKLSSTLNLSGAKNCSLRGSGAQSTKLNYTNTSAQINIGQQSGSNSATITSFTDSTHIVITGTTPPTGESIWVNQCSTGTSGSGTGCATGSESDNGSVFVCGNVNNCANQGASTAIKRYEEQYVLVTNISGTCASTCTLTVTPPLFMPDFTGSGRSPQIGWNDTSFTAVGNGFEDMTVDFTNGSSSTFGGGFQMGPCYASWTKGVRFMGANNGGNSAITMNFCSRSLFSNYYIFQTNPISGTQLELTFGPGGDSSVGNGISSNIILNGIIQGSQINAMEAQGMDSGNVYAYNYFRDVSKTQVYNSFSQHEPFSDHELFEGNQFGSYADDLTWTTHAFNGLFRNIVTCNDAPFTLLNARCITIDSLARFEFAIGNTIGGAGISTYTDTSAGTGGVYSVGVTTVVGTGLTDPLALSTLMRWGNYDTVNAANRFVSGEVPSALSAPNTAYSNPVPGNNNLPASFFMDSAVAHPSGGTGLSWWKVCTSFGTFPACTGTQTQPFPPIGPDVSGGLYFAGHAYDIPAAVYWKNAPIDTAYQHSYTISGSSWSGGTETLTITSLTPGSSLGLMGGFQVSGVNSACLPVSGVSYTGRSDGEILMTGSSSTTIQYATTNPGLSCTGTFKWPDVREFDETAFMQDSSGTPAPASALFAAAH